MKKIMHSLRFVMKIQTKKKEKKFKNIKRISVGWMKKVKGGTT